MRFYLSGFVTFLMLTFAFATVSAQTETPRQREMRENFRRETSEYRQSVLYLMQVHDTRLIVDGSQAHRPPVREDDWVKLRSDLAALDGLCKSRFAGIKDRPGETVNLDAMPATWCIIAARRAEYEPLGRQLAAADQLGPIYRGTIQEIQEALVERDQYIVEEIQLLMYEREKWRAAQKAKLQKRFDQMKTAMPASFFAEVEKKADELVAATEQAAPGRTFLMPKQKDSAVETFIRGRYATQLKGVQILKLGVDDAQWVIHRNSLGVPLSQTKVARLLVRVPNRPFCQEHSVAVERTYTRGALGAMAVEGNVGSEGLFMSCQ